MMDAEELEDELVTYIISCWVFGSASLVAVSVQEGGRQGARA